jgi:hypothetical protein
MNATVVQALNDVPSGLYTIAAGAVAALIAYFGVRHSLREHRERERIDRETDMRREVFFAAAEAVSRAETFVRQYGNFNLTDGEHRKLIDDLAARTAKIHIVGRLATIERIVAFSEKLNEIITKLSVQRQKMMELKSMFDGLNKRVFEIDAEIFARSVARADRASVQELEEANKRLLEQRHEMAKSLRLQSLELFDKSFQLASELEPLESSAVIAARKDLGFDTDTEAFDSTAYNQLLSQATIRQQTIWRHLIAGLKEDKSN